VNYVFLVGPAEQQMAEAAANYRGTASQAVAMASALSGGAEMSNRAKQPIVWASDLLSVSKALVPSMKLQRLKLAPGEGGRDDANMVLTISGALPSGRADNLKLVSVFIDRLAKDESFARRFSQINFAGAGENTDQAKPEMLFNVAAAPAGGAKK
jgi:hypothetical protein